MSNNPFDATTRREKIDATIRKATRGSESKSTLWNPMKKAMKNIKKIKKEVKEYHRNKPKSVN